MKVEFDIKYPIPSTIWYIEDGEPIRAILRGWDIRNNRDIRYHTYFGDLQDKDIYTTKEACEKVLSQHKERT